MRRVTVVLGLAALVATSAQAQRGSWQSELGIQGGYVRIKPTGTGANDQIDLLSLPASGNYLFGALASTSMFAVIPWRDKMAVEVGFAAQQEEFQSNHPTLARVGLRMDYAISPKIYAAAGGSLFYIENDGAHESQLGVHAAVGYRLPLTSRLNGRVEAQASFMKKASLIFPHNDYGLVFGVSSRTGGTAAARPAGASRSVWSHSLGVQGGYMRAHQAGGGQVMSGIFVPSLGSVLSGAGLPVQTPPTLFAIFPLGAKTAIEPGLNIDRIQSNGTTGFGANLAARLDYAVSGGWYGAVGGSLLYVKATAGTYGKESGTVFGGSVAWGYRYRMGGDLGGRVELNYALHGKNKDLPVPPQNVTSILVGMTMAVK